MPYKVPLPLASENGVPLPTPGNFESEAELTLLAQLIFGESRGESYMTKLAVGWTVRTRVENPAWWGDSYHRVILKPRQFSAFNANDPNRTKMQWPLKYEHERVWVECFKAAAEVYFGLAVNPTRSIGGADHYHSAAIMPSWAYGVSSAIQIGNLLFYKLRT